MLEDGGCEDYPFIETKHVDVGDHVKMTCSRRDAGDIFWMRIDSEYLPKILKETKNSYPHIKVRKDPGILLLQITEARMNDSGFYLCLRKYQDNWTYISLITLTVKESAVATVPTSASPHLQDTVTLSCSALHGHRNKSCPEDENLLCFRADSSQTLSSLNHTDNDEGGGIKFDSEGCFYSYFKNSNLSDAQIYHCAVAKHDNNDLKGKSNLNTKGNLFFITLKMQNDMTLIRILFTKITHFYFMSAENKKHSENYYTVACLLSVALAICLVIIAFLIYLTTQLNKRLHARCNVPDALQIEEPIKGNQESPKPHEDLVYSKVSTRKKASKKRAIGTLPEDQDVIYTEVNVLEL